MPGKMWYGAVGCSEILVMLRLASMPNNGESQKLSGYYRESSPCILKRILLAVSTKALFEDFVWLTLSIVVSGGYVDRNKDLRDIVFCSCSNGLWPHNSKLVSKWSYKRIHKVSTLVEACV